MSKQIPCGNEKCYIRRPHHERQDEQRGQQLCEVPDEYFGVSFCSIECACYAGFFNVRQGRIRDCRTGNYTQRTDGL